MIHIDCRENDLIQLWQEEKKDEKMKEVIKVKQLPVGDIWIGMDDNDIIKEGGLVIERKTIADFEASFLDGRYREQRGRILSFCHENKTQPMYILEGSLSSSKGRLQEKAIVKLINRLIFHYQIPVYQTLSLQETADLVETLVEQWKDDPSSLQRTTELVKVSDGIHVQKKANASDPKIFAISCLTQCNGVSVKMAEEMIKTFGSLKAVMNASVKELEQVKVGSRKVGPVVSKRLSELLNQ